MRSTTCMIGLARKCKMNGLQLCTESLSLSWGSKIKEIYQMRHASFTKLMEINLWTCTRSRLLQLHCCHCALKNMTLTMHAVHYDWFESDCLRACVYLTVPDLRGSACQTEHIHESLLSITEISYFAHVRIYPLNFNLLLSKNDWLWFLPTYLLTGRAWNYRTWKQTCDLNHLIEVGLAAR